LKMQRIELISGDVWGWRSDQKTHFEFSNGIITAIKKLKSEENSNEIVIDTVINKFKIDPYFARKLVEESSTC